MAISNGIETELINQLKEEIPGVDLNDLDSLVDVVVSIYEDKRKTIDESIDIDSWIPNKQTVKEILDSNVQIKDLDFCIKDFIQFAKTKNWGLKDNLDPKLIGHIKLMILNSKIELAVKE